MNNAVESKETFLRQMSPGEREVFARREAAAEAAELRCRIECKPENYRLYLLEEQRVRGLDPDKMRMDTKPTAAQIISESQGEQLIGGLTIEQRNQAVKEAYAAYTLNQCRGDFNDYREEALQNARRATAPEKFSRGKPFGPVTIESRCVRAY